MTACCNRFYNKTDNRAITTRFIRHPVPSGTVLSGSRTIARTTAGDTLACARLSDSILGLQPRDKAAMLGVKTKEYFLEEFT